MSTSSSIGKSNLGKSLSVQDREIDKIEKEELSFEDDEGYGSSSYEDGPVSASALKSMKVGEAVDYVTSLIGDVKANLSLPDDVKKKLLGKLEQLQKNLDVIKNPNTPLPKMYASQILDLQAEYIEKSTPEPDLSEFPLDKQLSKYLGQLQKDTNLIPAKRDELIASLQKMISAKSLKTVSDDVLVGQFEALKEQVANLSTQPQAVQRLATLFPAGTDLSEVTAAFHKYGVSPDKLPEPPNEAVARLLSDPELFPKIKAARDAVGSSSNALKSEIAKQVGISKDLNEKAEANKEEVRSQKDDSYKFLYLAATGQDELSKKKVNDRRACATEVAAALSLLYGKTVTAAPPPANGDLRSDPAGSITAEGWGTINLIPNSLSPELSFTSTNTTVDWPKVEIVPYGVDTYDKGKAKPPKWMEEVGWPMYAYDRKEMASWEKILAGIFCTPVYLEFERQENDSKKIANKFDAEHSQDTAVSRLVKKDIGIDTVGANAVSGGGTPSPADAGGGAGPNPAQS